MQEIISFLQTKIKQLSTEAKVFLIAKGLFWLLFLLLASFFGNLFSKLIWLDDLIVGLGALSTVVALKNPVTRAEVWGYIKSFNAFIRSKVTDQASV